jgi:hypothetical protein
MELQTNLVNKFETIALKNEPKNSFNIQEN